jgi:hypothetical protein
MTEDQVKAVLELLSQNTAAEKGQEEKKYVYVSGGKLFRLDRDGRLEVVNDAAADVPPISNLWNYVQMGFDLVTFSGGKANRARLLWVKPRSTMASAIFSATAVGSRTLIWSFASSSGAYPAIPAQPSIRLRETKVMTATRTFVTVPTCIFIPLQSLM